MRRIYPLTERGVHQQTRNNSQQIWNLFNCYDENEPDHVVILYEEREMEQTKDNIEETADQTKKENSFQLTQNAHEPTTTKDVNQTTAPTAKHSHKIKDQPTKNRQKAVKKQETEFQKWKRKSIEKYIKKQVPYTRTLSNSAFKKFYNRPCPETYGNRSTKQGGVCYGDFMKTHNIQPHTLENQPQFYQTYTSALNHGKRTKLDLEDRWKRIERQLAKNLDYRQALSLKQTQIEMNGENKDAVLKQNIRTYGRKNTKPLPQQQQASFKRSGSLDKMETRATFAITNPHPDTSNPKIKRSKSLQKPIYYLYKYKEGEEETACTRYAKDRHGITCYVDPTFRQNDEAFLNFQNTIKPIYAQPCKPDDMNIDAIRIKNNELSKEKGVSRHYLLPNVVIPYSAFNYSRKKASSAIQADG